MDMFLKEGQFRKLASIAGLILYLLFRAYPSEAQTTAWCGRIVSNGQPLPSAVVTLDRFGKKCFTDSLGNFCFPIKSDSVLLRISSIGFTTRMLVLKKTEMPTDIELFPSLTALDEFSVTGSVREVSRKRQITPVEVYSHSYLSRSAQPNLYEKIRYISGIQANIDGAVDQAGDIEINGMEGHYTVILLDGIPLYSGLNTLFSPIQLPSGLIDKIEVMRGPATTLYGSDAMGGVVNVITKKPGTGPKWSMETYFSSLLEYNTSLAVHSGSRKLKWMAGAQLTGLNLRSDRIADGYTDQPLHNRVNVYLKLAPERKSAKAFSMAFRYLFEDRIGGQMDYRFSDRGSRKIYGHSLQTQGAEANLDYEFNLRKGSLLFQSGANALRLSGFFGPLYFKGQQVQAFQSLKFTHQFKKVIWTAGISHRLLVYRDNLPTTSEGKNLMSQAALFFQPEFRFSAMHSALLGLRYEWAMPGNRQVLSPRLMYKWNSLDERNQIRIGVANGYRIPGLFSDQHDFLRKGYLIRVPSDLKPEQSVGGQLNYSYSDNLEWGAVYLDLGLFYNVVWRMALPLQDEASGAMVYRNSEGKVITRGGSALLNIRFKWPFSIQLGTTLLNGYEEEEAEDGSIEREPLINAPVFNATFALQYQWIKPGLTFDFNGYLNSRMRLKLQENDPRFNFSPWVGILNFRITKSFKKGVECFAGVENLLNVLPPSPYLRGNDPFNSQRYDPVNNPRGLLFDANYVYSIQQPVKGVFGVRMNW